MTEYFEIHERDGAARLGELRLSESVTTPALVTDVDDETAGGRAHPILEDAGSLWPEERDVPAGSEDRLTVLPHRSFPPGTADEVAETFAVDYPEVDYPNAVVVSTTTATDHGADVYLLSDARGAVGHGQALRETIVAVREAIPDDAALAFPGVATPANVATLAYAGVDLFDPHLAVVRGTQGRYLTTDGEARVEDLDELPCACPACRTPLEEFDREDCVTHNLNALAAAISTVRERIRAGRLRDYLEAQARHENWCTAAMREFDDEWGYLEERTPLWRTADMGAATDDALRRPEIRRFADRVTSRYRPRFDDPLVLVPCSAHKPYSESQSHSQFHDAVQYRGHLVSITSPIGVVPQELETTYPAQHYDAVVTGHWTETEIEFVAEVLGRYLDRADYSRIVAHVPEDYRPIVERATADRAVPVEYTVEDHPTTEDSLSNLSDALQGELKYGKRERQHNTIRAIADYQFGDGAGDVLFDDLSVQSRYPKLRAHDADGEQLAAMVPSYGTLSLTLAGARRWADRDVPTKRVEIDAFVPHGSVLAPGVVDASEGIRAGDEVVIEGPDAFAVGRARMHGRAMVESTRGVACDVRHVEEP
ncbi:MAG: archaeosine synthase [Halobacteriales archaeon]|jgi:archaeosine synthase